jgi:acyl transferase domain-containing protein/acyl carrier protein
MDHIDDFYSETNIAIIGLSCRFPGARNAHEYWHNVTNGIKSIRALSDEELLAAGVAPGLLNDSNYVRAGAILEDIDLFDAPFFGFTPREAETMDPQTRFFFQCAWEALEDAAYDPKTYNGLIGIFGGKGPSGYLALNLSTHPELLELVGKTQIESGNLNDALVSMVAYKLDLKGPSVSVQTFCSTSMVALHLACQSLLSYECDMALAGGAALSFPQGKGYMYQEGSVLSPDGECRTFDAKGQGTVVGSGVGLVVVKRLNDALEDGDHIYAVIRGSAMNNDGITRVSYAAPGLNGQASVIATAMGNAGVDPETISYIEAHGTGTTMGDAIELAALIEVFRHGSAKKQICALGSVKPNIGHADRASGIAGLIKATLTVKHKLLPPSLNFEQTSSDIDLDNSPFYVNTKLKEWESNGYPFRAGVNSFGMGGTNTHVVLEEAPERPTSSVSRPYQLLLISARTEASLEIITSRLIAHLKENPTINRADMAYTLQVGRATFDHRRMVVCREDEDISDVLSIADPRRVFNAHQVYQDRPIIFMFPGVGDHYVGMAHGLYQTERIFREWVDRCCDLLKADLNIDLCTLLYPQNESESVHSTHSGLDLRRMLGRENENNANSPLQQTALAQPVVFVIEYALAQLLMSWGIRPQAMIGYSLGEYVAACLSGVLSLEDALKLVAKRAAMIQSLEAGSMLAVPLSERDIQPYLRGGVALAASVAPNVSILAGTAENITAMQERLTAQDVLCHQLPTTHAFHSPMMMPIVDELMALSQTVTFNAPQIPYLSNVTGDWITVTEATDPAYWTKHLCQTVRFASGIDTLLQSPHQLFLEIGPGQSLGSFVKQHPACDHKQSQLVLPTIPHAYDHQPALSFMLTTLGKLWLAGASIDWTSFYAHERRYRLSLPTYAFEKLRYWIEPKAVLKNQPLLANDPMIAATSGQKPDIADWFYEPVWRKTEYPDLVEMSAATWLIFNDKLGVGDAVTDYVMEYGGRVIRVQTGDKYGQLADGQFVIRPHVSADYNALIRDLKAHDLLPKYIVHLWSATREDEGQGGPDYFATTQHLGFYSLIYLIRALSMQKVNEQINLTLVSSNAQPVTGVELLQPEKATIFGAYRAILQESLAVTGRAVDLDVTETDIWHSLDSIKQLMAELVTPSSDLEVAYRDGERYVRSYSSVRLPEKPALPWRKGGTYLITGGLGGIGLALAEHLAQNWQANLVLLGRSMLPDKTEWSHWLETHNESDFTSIKIRRVQKIESLGGHVLMLAADTANKAQMVQALANVNAEFGEIHGVFHAAGISDESAYDSIHMITEAQCERHFQPKIYGLYVLEDVLTEQSEPLDFCILFSSIASVLGGLGFTAYTAANIFMDTFAHLHNRSAKTKWVSVNWDTWQTHKDPHKVIGKTVAEYEMNLSQGIETLERIISNDIGTQIINSTGDLETRIRQWVMLESLSDGASMAVAHTSGNVRPDLTTTYVSARSNYEKQVAAVWQELLGIEGIGIYDNFFDLGGNSLIGLQVVARLKKRFDIHIPVVALFEAPTVSELAKYLQPVQIQTEDKQQTLLTERRQQARQKAGTQAIAIIGMAGRFPGADTINQFWENLCAGVESITKFTDDELLEAGIPPEMINDPQYVKARPIIENTDLFDATFFGFSPREAELTDPQHRLFLECAWEALETSGYDPKTYGGLIGLYAGRNISYYLERLALDPEFRDSLADYEAAYQIAAGNDKDALATGVAYKLNLKGPSLSIQTFCSTSLVATHMARQSLLNGECDIALAGGVSIRVPTKSGYSTVEGGMESLDGHCRAFDAQANGTLFGDGAAIVVLKRLEDALEDGDFIYGCIKGSAINNDGSLKAGFTAPSVAGQAMVIEMALQNAGVTADAIGYVEAHGTATPIGDPIEVTALTRAFRQTTSDTGYCALGSVKTNLGHLDHAAGAAGLIKATLVVQHGLIPPNLHFESPNPELDIENSPFYVNNSPVAWSSNGKLRQAGVSSLGVGGTNAHIIVTEPPDVRASSPSRSWQLLPISARTENALDVAITNLAQYLRQNPDINLADVAHTLQVGRHSFETRSMLVCQTSSDALSILESMDPRHLLKRYQPDVNRSVVFMFAGVGDHYSHIAQELYQLEPVFREAVNRCCDCLQQLVGVNLREVLYPAETQEQPDQTGVNLRQMLGRTKADDPVRQTEIAQPIVFTIEYALAQLLQSWGITPEALVGYSLGEYVAACIAGVLTLEDALLLVAGRAQLIQSLPQGDMLAVSLSESDLQPYLCSDIALAIVNGPKTCIVSGTTTAIAQLAQEWTEKEIPYRYLETTHAFHSNMMREIADDFANLIRGIQLKAPQIPYLSNVTGQWITATEATDPNYWVQHMCQTVRFNDNLDELLQDPNRILLEIGAGQSLGSFAKQHPACSREQMALIVPTIRARYDQQSDLAYLLNTVGKLWLAGYEPNWSNFYRDEYRHRLPLPTYPFERQRYWIEPNAPQSYENSRKLAIKQELNDWFYLPVWKQVAPCMPAVSVDEEQAGSCWLLLCGNNLLATSLITQLTDQDQTVVHVQPGLEFKKVSAHQYTLCVSERANYDALLKSLQQQGLVPTKVIHAWSVDMDSQSPNSSEEYSLEQALDTGLYSLVRLTQAMAEADLTQYELTVVSSHVHAVTSYDQVRPQKATIVGPCKVIPQEFPQVSCRLIDVSLDLPYPWQKEALLTNVYGELTADFTDVTIALRGNQRWVQDFSPIELTPIVDKQSALLKSNGVYVITGGLGGIGLAMAEYLAQTVQAKLVLISRSGLPDRSEWSQTLAEQGRERGVGYKIDAVQKLEKLGAEILIVTADIADEAQTKAAIEQAKARFGTINGVLHAAGVPGVGLIRLKTTETMAEVLAPKVMGTLVLEKVLKDVPLDFLVLFSSTSSIVGGGPGQVDYSASNAFLDAYALHYQGHKRKTISVNWNEWQWNAWDEGLAGFGGDVHQHFQENRQRYGISFAEGQEVLARVLNQPIANIVVSPQNFPLVVKSNRNFTVDAILSYGRENKQSRTIYPRPALGIAYVAPRNEAEEKVANIWTDILGIEGIGIYDNFFELGGNSLVGIELVSRLRKQFEVEAVPIYIIYESPSISDMAQYLRQETPDETVSIMDEKKRGDQRRQRLKQLRQDSHKGKLE